MCVEPNDAHTRKDSNGVFIWHQHDVSHFHGMTSRPFEARFNFQSRTWLRHSWDVALIFCHAEYCMNTLKFRSRRKLVGKVLWTGTLLWPWTPSTFSLLFYHHLSLLVVGVWTLGRRTERGCQWTKLKNIYTHQQGMVWVAVTITPELCIYKFYIQLVVKFKTISTHR